MESTSEVVSNTAGEKCVSAEELPKSANTPADKPLVAAAEEATQQPLEEAANAKQEIEQVEAIPVKKNEIEQVVEQEEEFEEESDASDEVDTQSAVQKEVAATPNSEQIKTTTVTTVKKVTPEGTSTVVTTSSVSKDQPSVETTTTVITTTPAAEKVTSTTTTTETAVAKPSEPAVSVTKQDEATEPAAKPSAQEDANESAEESQVEDDEEEEVEEEEEEVEEAEDAQVSEKVVAEVKQPAIKDQIQPENQAQPSSLPIATVKEKPVVDTAPVVAPTTQQENAISNKQESLNNTIKDIISNIDSNIQAQENIAALKERELELLKKQQELAKEIEQQKLLAQQLASENQYKQQLNNNNYTNLGSSFASKPYQPLTNVSKYSTFEETQDNNIFSRKSETFETRESTNVSKKIDLHKIFTPATDAEEILPKNRKLYASSAFYSPTLHPTVEDQVELARRISHSLSDISNQQSRGQSMYVNRKKRSVKWVHEGSGQDYHQYQQQPKTSTSPSILPAYTDAAKHRVQLNLHQEQLLEKYAKPGLKVVQTPWEAALNSGSASAAFIEEQKLSPFSAPPLTPSPSPQIFDASQGGIPIPSAPTVRDSYSTSYSNKDYNRYQTSLPAAPQQQQIHHERPAYTGTNSKRELAYKPSIPQGWKAPSMSLPKDLYMPKEIPLQSYAPPPVTNIPAAPVSPYPTSGAYETNQFNAYRPTNDCPNEVVAKPYGTASTFPVSKPYQPGFSATYGNAQPPKQQYLPPQSYQRVPQSTSQNVPQVNFNPSPLPYDKLAKFENPPPADEGRYIHSPAARTAHLNVRASKVRNTSPAPFAASPTSDSYNYGGTPSISPRPLSATQQYSGHNTPNFTHSNVTSNQLLNAPSYNTSARGWGCAGGASSGYQHPQSYLPAAKPQMVNTSSMPYTDF